MNTIVPLLILVAALLCLWRFLRRSARTTSSTLLAQEPIPSPDELASWIKENDRIYEELVAEGRAIDVMLGKPQKIASHARRQRKSPRLQSNREEVTATPSLTKNDATSSAENQRRSQSGESKKAISKFDLDRLQQNSLKRRQNIRDAINQLNGPLRDRLMRLSFPDPPSQEASAIPRNLAAATGLPQHQALAQEIKIPKRTSIATLCVAPLRIVTQCSKIVMRPVIRIVQYVSSWFSRQKLPANSQQETSQRRAA